MADVPFHIALIADGNRRWAREHALTDVNEGHTRGVEVLRSVADTFRARGVKMLTAWLFSTENWNRSKAEVDHLMNLFRRYFKAELPNLLEKKIRFRHLGDRSRFAPDIQEMLLELEDKTRHFTDFYYNAALNYGGRAELVEAVRRMIADGRGAGEITPDLFSSYLYTAGLPDPDLIIRTSGERRLSGFMPWQQEYAEFYFAPWHFPDFTPGRVDEILEDYAKRERRHGK